MPVDLYPHQLKAVNKLHDGAVLVGGVGSGKSMAALAYFYTKVCGGVIGEIGSVKKPMDLVVITTAKKRDSLDWEKEALKFHISAHGDLSADGMLITVDSWNNIGDYVEDTGKFFIFDEQRAVGRGQWSKSFIKIAHNNQWILLSATPGDTWMDYVPIFIANGFYKNRTDFNRRHVVYNHHAKFPKVDRYVETGHLNYLRSKVVVHMPYLKHTTRHSKTIEVDYDKQLFDRVVKDRWNVYENRPLRDVAELFSVMRKVVNTDSSRLTEIHGLLKEHPRLIVFYNFDYELEILRTLGPSAQQNPSNNSTIESDFSSTARHGNPPLSESICLESTDQLPSGSEYSKNRLGAVNQSSIPVMSWDEKVLQIPNTSLRDGSDESCLGRSVSVLEGVEPVGTAGSKLKKLNLGPRKEADSYTVAEWNGHKHQPIPKTDSWVYLVQYMSGAEGWNCIETNAMSFYSLTYSYKLYEQSHGRIERLNTPFNDLFYYTLKSTSPIDRAISKALGEKRNFNEADFGKKL